MNYESLFPLVLGLGVIGWALAIWTDHRYRALARELRAMSYGGMALTHIAVRYRKEHFGETEDEACSRVVADVIALKKGEL